MALSNMAVFNQYVPEAAAEYLAQMIDKFNAASNNTIVLTSEGFDGDFLERSFFSTLEASQRRVDRYATNDAQASTDLAQVQENSVKIAGGFGPITFEPAQFTWMQRNESEAIRFIGESLARGIMKDQLNSAIAALVAAISNVAGATNDVSGSAGLSYTAFNDSHALFGDASGNLVAQVMNGTAYHKLVGANLANDATLFRQDNVLVTDILGRPTIVTDAPALYEAGTPNKLKVLSLAPMAAVIMDGSTPVTNMDVANGTKRITASFQADYDFGLGLKGYSWDEANGGKSPTDAEIATGSNWDATVSSVKNSAGVITIGDAAQ